MDTALLAQYVVIALAVVASAWFVFRRQFPGAAKSLRIAIALPLVRQGRPPWLQRLGRRIAPPASIAGGACGGCDGCGPDGR